MSRAIRIAHLDDHPAILVGLEAITATARDLLLVGSVRHERDLMALVERTRADVVVTDLHHGGRDGLELALDITRAQDAPAVVIYTATVDDHVVVSAMLAGAGAVVSKSSPPVLLLDAIRRVAINRRTQPQVSAQMRAHAAAWFDPTDYAILAMRVAGESPIQIGYALGLTAGDTRQRIRAIIARLEAASDSTAVGAASAWTALRRVA